jgi:hypothetical protein
VAWEVFRGARGLAACYAAAAQGVSASSVERGRDHRSRLCVFPLAARIARSGVRGVRRSIRASASCLTFAGPFAVPGLNTTFR